MRTETAAVCCCDAEHYAAAAAVVAMSWLPFQPIGIPLPVQLVDWLLWHSENSQPFAWHTQHSHHSSTPRSPLPAQLVDWLLWHNENSQPFAWLGADWGERGGITARELALWITLQVAVASCSACLFVLPTGAELRLQLFVSWLRLVPCPPLASQQASSLLPCLPPSTSLFSAIYSALAAIHHHQPTPSPRLPSPCLPCPRLCSCCLKTNSPLLPSPLPPPLQREYRARGLLPGEALSRFEALGVQWDCTDGTPAEREWMAWFGRLLYVIERHNSLTPTVRGSVVASLPGRPPKIGRPRGRAGGGGGSYDRDRSEYGGYGSMDGEDSEDEEEAGRGGAGGGARGARGRGSAAVAAARLRLQAEVAARRAALVAADLASEPGLRFWLARQRRRWRRQELPAELELLLQLAGVQLDCYSPAAWQTTAHAAAGLLQGSRVQLGPKIVHPAALVQTAAGLRVVPRAAQRAQPAAEQQQAQQVPGDQLAASGAPAEAPATAAALAAAAAAGSGGGGSSRLQVARWVQTQQALFAQGKLSSAQLRYMAFLGEEGLAVVGLVCLASISYQWVAECAAYMHCHGLPW